MRNASLTASGTAPPLARSALFPRADYERSAPIAAYQGILQSAPNDTDAHFNLGVSLYRKGNYTDAAVQFREVLRLDPTNADAEQNLRNITNFATARH
jgi:Flp pilus assembly protein TadD